MVSTKKANRPAKRNLVRWNDDLDKQVLLIVQYACNEAGVRIPWDDVARMMCEVTDQPVTGGAIIQHLSKLRSRMESYELGVPPPLKRGLPANNPSKIYAPGNKRKVKPRKATIPMSSTVKPKKPKPRKLKREDGEDSDDTTNFYEGEEEDSNDEYGSTKKKRRVSGGEGKDKKQLAAVPEKNEDMDDDNDGDDNDLIIETLSKKSDDVKGGTSMAEPEIQESIEGQSSSPRTRGVKHNYAKMDIGSDENGDEAEDGQAEEELEEEDEVTQDINSRGEISPRTNLETFVASQSRTMARIPPHVDHGGTNDSQDLTRNSIQRYPDVGFGLDIGSAYHFGQSLSQQQAYQTQQYQMPVQTGLGFPQSTSSSFSTNRTGSMASLTSATVPVYTPFASPGSYVPIINSGMTANDFVNDEIIYGDQYMSPVDYSSSGFLSSFSNPFSIPQKDGESGAFR